MGEGAELDLRPVIWIGPSREIIRRFPEDVQDEFGFALYQAQLGAKHTSAKPLRGFSGAGVLEVVADHDGNTYRTVYTVRFRAAVYALHAFQKKSSKGTKTPLKEIQLVGERLKQAQAHYRENYEQQDHQKSRPDRERN